MGPKRARALSVFGVLQPGKGGGREVYCGESILSSDFHLLFTCWVLFMLPAVSHSGGGVCQGWGVRGSVGTWLGYRLPIGVCVGGLCGALVAGAAASGRNRRMDMSVEVWN